MKVVISDLDHINQNEEREVFDANHLTFELKQSKTEDDVIKNCKGAEVILNQYAPFTRRVIEALKPELKAIIRYGVGVNNIDVEAATELGVQVCNVPDYGMNEVAEHALALTMDLARKTTLMDNDVHQGHWSYKKSVPIWRLSEQTLGIAGLGRNGRAFAAKSRGIFKKVIGYDPYYKPNAKDGTEWIESVSVEDLLKNSDILVLHMPLTKETSHIINSETLSKMKPTAYLVNVSRGGLVNEKDLVKALDQKKIAGAALDVTEEEPLDKNSELLKYENILITPHMAWYSQEAESELKRKTAEEAVRFIKGEKLRDPVNHVAKNA